MIGKYINPNFKKHATDGKDALKKGIEELIKNHYIIRNQTRNSKGQLIGYEYQVYEVPRKQIRLRRRTAI